MTMSERKGKVGKMFTRIKDRVRRTTSQEMGSGGMEQKSYMPNGAGNSSHGSGGPGGTHSSSGSGGTESKLTDLSSFDSCVEACDAVAASSSYGQPSVQRDNATGLQDCSVLVSPDGDLLLVPQEKDSEAEAEAGGGGGIRGGGGGIGGTRPMSSRSLALSMQKEMFETDEYQSAVVMGNDLQPSGDRKVNGFSTLGYSATAASIAIRQTNASLVDMTRFVEELVLSRKESTARMAQACDTFISGFTASGPTAGDMNVVPPLLLPSSMQKKKPLQPGGGYNSRRHSATRNSLNDLEPLSASNWKIGGGGLASSASAASASSGNHRGAETMEPVPTRVGPMRYTGGTLHAATVALEQYNSSMAENDSNRWRKANMTAGYLGALRQATDQAAERSYHREKALKDMQRRANEMEEQLRKCKDEARQRWISVYEAEELVTKIVEERMMMRSRERERQRMEQFRAEQADFEQNKTELGATNGEIWEIVSSVTADMEAGDFAPLDLPQAPVHGPRDVSRASSEATSVTTANTATTADSGGFHPDTGAAATTVPVLVDDIPMRSDIEQECRLPELRALAMGADDAVEDAAAALLNVLSNLDTTRRSARVSAETCLLSACNAQASCLREMVKVERASIEERLRNVEELERIVSNIDVRKDLDAYISQDKRERGGSTWLGDDDDGGVASALAVLSSHVDGNMGFGMSPLSKVYTVGWEDREEDEVITAERIEDAIDDLFLDDEPDLSSIEPDEYEKNVAFLCRIAEDKNHPSSRSRRSAMCYALNSKRTSAELKGKTHFDAVSRVIYSILTGCDREAGGVANSKMSMMLAQTFYIIDDDNDNNDDGCGDSADAAAAAEGGRREKQQQSRERRIFVKSRLYGHPLWEDDEFWDQALFQCVAESLTHSGVMSNFERGGGHRGGGDHHYHHHHHHPGGRSEWTETRKLKWHDLSLSERCEAASQVHAVVFAQLGALAHSMVEFGCGLERSCGFVRRMAVRNQLPISQRAMLLQHLMGRAAGEKDDRTAASATAASNANTTTTKKATTAAETTTPTTAQTTGTEEEEEADADKEEDANTDANDDAAADPSSPPPDAAPGAKENEGEIPGDESKEGKKEDDSGDTNVQANER